jgi:CDP-diacylglycerol pyrophosphatase
MKGRPWRLLAAALGCVAVVAAGVLAGPALLDAADPDALWNIVHGLCVPHQEIGLNPAPCAVVSLGSPQAPGYAVLKDRDGQTQYLLIPTDKITGIEDTQLLKPDSEAYLVHAWAFRALDFARIGHALPDRDMSLAINSEHGRTQNQLHIHIDCVRQSVRDALARDQDSIGPELKPMSEPLAGHVYEAMAIPAPDLERTNLFRLLARTVPEGSMGRETLVVIGATLVSGQPGFDVLVDRADPAQGDVASGEQLQDHDCALSTDQT